METRSGLKSGYLGTNGTLNFLQLSLDDFIDACVFIHFLTFETTSKKVLTIFSGEIETCQSKLIRWAFRLLSGKQCGAF